MIFNLFKSKPILKDLIPKGFIDIHSHILPGIDDGAKNIEDSISLISRMKKLGFSKIIGTPHTYPGLYENTNESIKEAFDKINKKKSNNVELAYASEYMLDNSLVDLARNSKVLTLKNKYILVEMSYIAAPYNLYEILFELKLMGYIPVLAHPERYRFLFNNYKNNYMKLKKIGCKFQLNFLSTTDFYGIDIAKMTDWLLKNEFIDYVGSDIHSIKHISYFDEKLKVKNVNQIKLAINKTIDIFS